MQLARLAVWIHTFVPGLPLSFLDHNLVHGNSLVGVGTVDQIRNKFEELDALPLFPLDATSLLGRAAAPLRRLANLNDATLGDISAARVARREAGLAIRSTETLCDLIAAQPIADEASPITKEDLGKWDPGRDDGGLARQCTVRGERSMDCTRSIFRLRSRRSSSVTGQDSMSSWGIRRGRRPLSRNTRSGRGTSPA